MPQLPRAARRTPAAIGPITVTLSDNPARGDQPAARGAMVEIIVLDDAGRPLDAPIRDELLQHLTPAQKTGLNNLLDAIRTKAAEVLL